LKFVKALKLMAKKKSSKKKKNAQKSRFQLNDRNRLILGLGLLFVSILLFVALISFFFNWKFDQSNLALTTQGEPAKNLAGKLGALIGNTLIYKGFGVLALLIPYAILYSGLFQFCFIHFIMISTSTILL